MSPFPFALKPSVLPITLSGTMIDLKPKHLETVRELLALHVPESFKRIISQRDEVIQEVGVAPFPKG